LIIGGAGFLGAAVCAQLLKDGDEPVVFDAQTSNVLEHIVGHDTAREISIRGDATNGLALLEVAKGRAVDAIIHLAALQTPAGNRDPWAALNVNCGSFINALETARILGLRAVAYASSWALYRGYREGELDGKVVSADTPLRPVDLYGGTKLLCELLAKRYAEAHRISSAGFRFPWMTGPGREHRRAEPEVTTGTARPLARMWAGIKSELIEKPTRGLPGRVPFGDDVANWLWTADGARGLALSARASLGGARTYNIVGDIRPVRDAVAAVRTLIPGADVDSLPGRHGDQPAVDTRPLREDLGFEIEWRMEDQIAALLELARRDA
jgi:nucleoside-diphosphate-sugar epimerase